MGTARVEEFSPDVEVADLVAALVRDGCALIERAVEASQLQALNRELDSLIASTPPGVRREGSELPPPGLSAQPLENAYEADALRDASPGDIDGFMREFYGADTVRFDGLPGKSATFVEVMCHRLLLGAADHFLLANCQNYTLNTGQLIEIRPGETEQVLHRDEGAWLHYREARPELSVEAMFALSDFKRENGATRIVPGSHRWDEKREPKPDEIAVAEMSAGSAVVYLGSTLHGGGANRTQSERRRGMFLGFCLGWLRTEENTFLSTPIEAVRGMPERAQELLGYQSHLAIGVVNVDSPMRLLRNSS